MSTIEGNYFDQTVNFSELVKTLEQEASELS
jgi:hypothetical protein